MAPIFERFVVGGFAGDGVGAEEFEGVGNEGFLGGGVEFGEVGIGDGDVEGVGGDQSVKGLLLRVLV